MNSAAPALTLIIPSVHTRAALLDRALVHLEQQKFSGHVVISDHSAPAQQGPLARVAERYPTLSILLLEHDSAWHFVERLTDCAEACSTPYVAVHADDDFMFTDALEACARFLDENADYSAAKGRMLFFQMAGAQLGTVTRHDGYARTEKQPSARLLGHLANFNASLYAVHRRTQFIEAYRSALAYTRNVIFWQYLASAITVLQGKFAVLEQPYYYRLDNPQGWRATLIRERAREHWPALFLAEDFSFLLGEFHRGLRGALEGAGTVVNKDLEQALEDASLWLLRRALCGAIRDPNCGEGDKLFVERALAAGSDERRRLEQCARLAAGGAATTAAPA